MSDLATRIFGDLADAQPLPAIVVEPHYGGIVWSNQAAQSLGLVSPLRGVEQRDATPSAQDELTSQDLLELPTGQNCSGRCQLLCTSGGSAFVAVFGRAVECDGARLIAAQLVDISEEHRRRRELEARDRAFAGLIAANFDTSYDWDLETGEISFSAPFLDAAGLPKGGSVTTIDDWAAYLHPDEAEEVMKRASQAIQSLSLDRDEYRMRRADGSYILVSDSALTVVGPDGKAERVVGVVRDVTKEREAERALQERAELYQTLFKGGSTLALHIASDGRFIEANEAALTFLEVSHDDLLRRNAADCFAVWEDIVAQSADGTELVPRRYDLNIEVGGRPKSLILSTAACHVGGSLSYLALGTDVTAIVELTEALRCSEESSRAQADALADRTTALRVIMEQREQDRVDLGHNIQTNMEVLVAPILGQLRRSLAARPELAHIEALGQTLNEIMHPFTRRLGIEVPQAKQLTARELEIVNLIQSGMTSDQIAESLYISRSTVAFHRANIRKKLGVNERGRRFSRHLVALAGMPDATSESETRQGA